MPDASIKYLDKEMVALTMEGITRAGMVSPPASNAEVHERIKNLLKPKEMGLFDHLSDGHAQVKEDIAASMGHTNIKSKGFKDAVTKLSDLGILEAPIDASDPKKKMVQLTEIAFPFGCPGINGSSADTVMSIISNEDAEGIKEESA